MNIVTIEDQLTRRVLRCFGHTGHRKYTEAELKQIYNRMYPLPRIQVPIHRSGRIIGCEYLADNVLVNVRDVLQFLCKEGYCSFEFNNFQVLLYSLTEKGRLNLNKRR